MKKPEKKLKPFVKVGVLVPSAGMWEMDFGKSLVGLFSHTVAWRPDPELGCERMQVQLYCLTGSMLVTNRHKLIVSAMNDGCTHILFLDDDMTFPPDMLINMLLSGKEVVAANYNTRTFPVKWVAHDLAGEEMSSAKKNGFQKAQHVGCGAMMVSREVLLKLTPPLFMMEWIPDVGSYCGEDVYFCAKIQAEAGEDIWVDHTLSQKIKHVGKLRYYPELIGHELPGQSAKED